jgi:NAD(P)-dependent dehydrogenase (short-subunit alcohol dehydrogenase family)
VSSYEACGELIAAAVAWGGKLDVLVNVAGVGGFVHTTEETPENFARTLGVNLHGPFNTARHALPHLLETQGNIVNVVGNGGKVASPIHLAGGAANAALMLATAGLANAYAAQGIRVNAINPGLTRTDRLKEGLAADARLQGIENEEAMKRAVAKIPMGRMAEPEEIARVVLFLASDAASYVTGINMSMDGATTPLIV